METMYEDFCEEKGCELYGTLTKLNSIEDPSILVRKQKEIIKERCKEKCQYTAYDFYQWLRAIEMDF